MDFETGQKWAKKSVGIGKPRRGDADAAPPMSPLTPPESAAASLVVVDAAGGVQAVAEATAPDATVDASVTADVTPTSEGSEEEEGSSDALAGAARDQRDILLSLPEPEPELQAAMAAPDAMSPEAMQALVARLWAKRQAELAEAFKGAKTEAQQMQGLLKTLLTGQREVAEGEDAPSTPSGLLTDSERISILQDLEYFVSSMHNAEDFTSMGGLTAAVALLNDTSLDVALHAAWVLGTAVKYAPGLQAAAVEKEGALPGVLALLAAAADAHTAHAALLPREGADASAWEPALGSPLAAVWGAADGKPAVVPVAALARGVYALGGLLRGAANTDAKQALVPVEAQRQFVAAGGLDVLRRVLTALAPTAALPLPPPLPGTDGAAPSLAAANGDFVRRQARGVVAKAFGLLRDLQVEGASALAAAGSGSSSSATAGLTQWSFAPALEAAAFEGKVTPPAAVAAAARRVAAARGKRPVAPRPRAVNTINGGGGSSDRTRNVGVTDAAAAAASSAGSAALAVAVSTAEGAAATGSGLEAASAVAVTATRPTLRPPLCDELATLASSMARLLPQASAPAAGADAASLEEAEGGEAVTPPVGQTSVDVEIASSLLRAWEALAAPQTGFCGVAPQGSEQGGVASA